ncbi:MAG: hypothetical protein AAFQ80_17255 [Cyanobacteria bacterium J06621_8]
MNEIINNQNNSKLSRTINKEDTEDYSKLLAKKEEQTAANSWDTASHVEVITCFPVKDKNSIESVI